MTRPPKITAEDVLGGIALFVLFFGALVVLT